MSKKAEINRLVKPNLLKLPCVKPCSKVIKFYTDREIGPNTGISPTQYTKISGYKFINIFVRFTQENMDESPVNLGVMFAFDEAGTMHSRRYVNFDNNIPYPQSTNYIHVTPSGGAEGHNSYIARFPVMGPYIQVFVYNEESSDRLVSVWAYLVA